MDFNHYQRLAARTRADNPSREMTIAILGLGLTGEAGEAAEDIKHFLGHGHELNLEKLVKELGDVLWYVSQIADVFNIKLADVARLNIEKLMKRYPDGFSTEHSIARKDENGDL